MWLRYRILGAIAVLLSILVSLVFLWAIPKNSFVAIQPSSLSLSKVIKEADWTSIENLFHSNSESDHISEPIERVVSDLTYLGKNQRPDSKGCFWMQLGDTRELKPLHLNEWYYIQFFSENPLQLTWSDHIDSATIALQLISEFDSSNHLAIQAKLKDKSSSVEKTITLHQTTKSFEASIGTISLDRHYLSNLKVSWSGEDVFLQRYATSEFPESINSQRIDFQDSNGFYFCFVRQGEYLVYREGRWSYPLGSTNNYPLLYIKSIQASKMEIQIWDETGLQKCEACLNQLSLPPANMEYVGLKYIGDKTPEKWMVCTKMHRLSLQPGDWLLYHSKEGWIPLNTVSRLDEYVQNPFWGDLIIVEKVYSEGKTHYLLGKAINTSRNREQSISIRLE